MRKIPTRILQLKSRARSAGAVNRRSSVIPVGEKRPLTGTATSPGYRSFELEQLEKIVWVPTGCFSSGFDASFAFVGANQAKREAAQDGHVLGAAATAVARQIVLEFNVEQPMHTLHAPMSTSCVGEPVDIERSRRDVETGGA